MSLLVAFVLLVWLLVALVTIALVTISALVVLLWAVAALFSIAARGRRRVVRQELISRRRRGVLLPVLLLA